MPAIITTITGEPVRPAVSRRKRYVRAAGIALWAAIIGLVAAGALSDPTFLNFVAATAFVLLFVCVNAQLLLVRWMANRHWRRLMARFHGSSYMSDRLGLPNRNYLLSELRREIPLARATDASFVLLLISLDSLEEVRARRGEDFCERATLALGNLVRRVTRHADFAAHLGDARYCVMLNDCRTDQAWGYLRTIPGSVAVSDGHQMFDVPVSARMAPYDMEMLYATDVLAALEVAPSLRRREQFFGSEAA